MLGTSIGKLKRKAVSLRCFRGDVHAGALDRGQGAAASADYDCAPPAGQEKGFLAPFNTTN